MKVKAIKFLSVALFLCATFFICNKTFVHGATRNVLYLEVNEKYTISLTSNKPVLYKYGDEDKKIVSASISSSKVLTIKPIKAGTATLYVCKDGEKKDANIVRTIKVHSYAESSNILTTISNNISHSASDDDNYSNVSVYCYGGRGFTLSVSASGIPSSVEAGATGGASGYVASYIYEVANSSGANITNNKFYLTPNSLASRSRYFKASGGYNSMQTTYVKGLVHWTSSNGTKHYTKARVINVYDLPCPYINVYNSNGNSISSLNCILGEPQKITYGVIGIGASPITDKKCEPSDDSKASVDEDGGGYLITPLARTFAPTFLKFTVEVDNWIVPYNGEEYSTFTKDIGLNIATLPTPNFTGVYEVNEGLKVCYDFVNGAGTYNIYRALSSNGDFEIVGTTAEKFYIDTEAEYNVEYFYRVSAVGTGGEEESSLSESKSGIRKIYIPQILAISNHKNGLKISYKFVKNIDKYNIYRSDTPNGEYELLESTSENYYIDTTASFNKTYYYKISGLVEDQDYETPLSNCKSSKRFVLVPSISYVKGVGSGLYQIKIDSVAKYSGYEIYINGKLKAITSSEYATLKLNPGIYKIKAKAYKTVGKSKIYSNYSKIYKKTIKPKKPKIKRMVLRGRWIIKLKKQKKINGFIIKYSKTKSFKKFKTKRTKKTTFKIKRKYKYIKIVSYKKVGNTYLVSKSKKYKLKRK